MKAVKAQERFDEPVTATVLEQAIVRGRERRGRELHATAVQYLPAFESLLIGFADQSAVVLPVKNYPELAELNTTELEHLAVGFGGSALCLDERNEGQVLSFAMVSANCFPCLINGNKNA